MLKYVKVTRCPGGRWHLKAKKIITVRATDKSGVIQNYIGGSWAQQAATKK